MKTQLSNDFLDEKLKALELNKTNPLIAIFNAFHWRTCRNNTKKVLKFLVQNAQQEQFTCYGTTINRGEYHSSQRLIAYDIKLGKSVIKTALKHLVNFGLIKVKRLPSRHGSIITILNFECYEDIEMTVTKKKKKRYTKSSRFTNKVYNHLYLHRVLEWDENHKFGAIRISINSLVKRLNSTYQKIRAAIKKLIDINLLFKGESKSGRYGYTDLLILDHKYDFISWKK